MTIERPDWNLDNRGEPLAPSTPSEVIIREMETLPGPSEATKRAFADDAPGPVVSTQVRDAKGNIIRPDWNQKAPTVYQKPEGNVTRPDWDKPRNEAGQFITKSESDLRETWAKEGGYEANVARVVAAENAILSLSDNPTALQNHIGTLPLDIQRKAADVMRLSASYGPLGGVFKFEQFCDSLSPSEWETFQGFWRKLSRGDQDAILAGISR
jgi:hypothetical protein